jgi:hypothetical protein
VIHYHGTPITPRIELLALAGAHFCVSFRRPDDLPTASSIGQSLLLDNGAYTIWRRGGRLDVDRFAAWAEPLIERRENWLVIPDEVDGGEDRNDELIAEWEARGMPREQCAPVWHMDEEFERLQWLCEHYPRVCLGSSGIYAEIGDARWHRRMCEAMNVLCGNGPAPCWLHMLRGLHIAISSEYPFASADSSNVGQNHNRNRRAGNGAARMVQRIDAQQAPARWRHVEFTPALFEP